MGMVVSYLPNVTLLHFFLSLLTVHLMFEYLGYDSVNAVIIIALVIFFLHRNFFDI
jgi:type IV secretory pathway TrbL component